MAAKGMKIRGITVEIGADTSGLSTALRDANTQINTTQRELKDVERLLKLDPKNTELLAQKSKLLGDRVSETASKLEILKQTEEKLKANGIDENSQQFQALRREILETENALRNAQKAADDFSPSLEKAAASFGQVSSAAGAVAESTKALSGAAAGVIGTLGAMAYSAVTGADDLNTLAKQTGLSTDALQKMQYASDLVDVSVEDITGAVTKMKSKMAGSPEAFEKLGISVTDANGEMRDVETTFQDVLKALSYVGNETERDQLAMEIFGKSADSLAGIIDDGGEALRNLGADAEAMGLIMSGETLDSLNEVNDKIDKLKATAKAELAETGAKAMEALLPVFEKVTNAISGVLEVIGGLSTEQIEFVLVIAAVVAAISPIAGIIAGITGAISTFLTIIPQIQTAFTAVTTFAAANPIVLIAAAIAALAVLIIANWDKIKPILEQIWTTIKNVIDKIVDYVKGVIDTIKEFFKSIVNGIIGFLNKIIGAINWVIDKLNLIHIDVPAWLTKLTGVESIGFDIAKLQEIPMLAKGGIVSQGTAIVGERGPELLSVAGGRAVVQPLTNNYTTNNINQTSTQPIQLSVEIDGTVAARALYDPLQKQGSLRGSSLVGGLL